MRIIEEVVKNTDVGINAINSIRSYVEDEELMHKVLCQREELKRIQQKAQSEMDHEEIKDSKPNRMEKFMLKTGIRMNTLFDKSNDNIAAMLIEGTNMGINSIQKEINTMQREGEEVPAIATELMSAYQKNINELRTYL